MVVVVVVRGGGGGAGALMVGAWCCMGTPSVKRITDRQTRLKTLLSRNFLGGR